MEVMVCKWIGAGFTPIPAQVLCRRREVTSCWADVRVTGDSTPATWGSESPAPPVFLFSASLSQLGQ
jgi:hypothetical protein